jgi:hypothetical protein
MKRATTLALLAVLAAPLTPDVIGAAPTRPFRAKDVFDTRQAIVFQDDFRTGTFERWNFSEDDRYKLLKETPERIQIVDAPGLGAGRKAVRFTVPRAPNSFRAEISLPHENGFQERWYGGRVLIPHDWVFDPNRGEDIVLQWHAIPGNWRATFPNLSIAVQQESWHIRQSFGHAQASPTRTSLKLDGQVQRGSWVTWVIHAKWSPGPEGVLQIWKDGMLVADRKGPNVYGTIGVEYTPYLKTGIYHPAWHTDTAEKRAIFDRENPVATTKVVYVTDIKIGDARASYDSVAPAKAEPR